MLGEARNMSGYNPEEMPSCLAARDKKTCGRHKGTEAEGHQLVWVCSQMVTVLRNGLALQTSFALVCRKQKATGGLMYCPYVHLYCFSWPQHTQETNDQHLPAKNLSCV